MHEHARSAIEAAKGDGLDRRVLDDVPLATHVRRRRRDGRRRLRAAGEALGKAQRPVFYLAIPPAAFLESSEHLAGAGLRDRCAPRRGEALRDRSRLGPRAEPAPDRARAGGAPLPDRPLPRQGARAGHHVPPLRERACSSRSGTASTSTRSRSRWPRTSGRRPGGFYDRSARSATSSRTISAGARPRDDGASWPATTTRSAATGRRVPLDASSTRRTPCAVSTRATTRSRASSRAPTPRRSSAFDSMIQNWRWSGVPIFVRAGKGMPVNATEIVVRLQHVPDSATGTHRLGVPRIRRHRLPDRTGAGDDDRALRRRHPARRTRETSRSTSLLHRGAREVARVLYERLLTDALHGDSVALPALGRHRGDVADRAAAPGRPTRRREVPPRHVGAEAGGNLARRHGGWREPP